MIQLKRFNSREALFLSLEKACEHQLKSILAQKGIAHLAVPGGTTPAPLFERLSHLSLDWKNINIALTDERWLPITHSDSNECLIRKTLLIHKAKQASFLGMKNAYSTPKAGLDLCNAHYKKEIGNVFSLIISGMGNDGHFASLFPNKELNTNALRFNHSEYCVAIDAKGSPVAGKHTQRMSLTLSTFLKSEAIYLLFTGKDKWLCFDEALKNKNDKSKPIHYLLHQKQVPITVYWAE
jgi:6-phosphogluconolactonase